MKYCAHVKYKLDEYVLIEANSEEEAYDKIEDVVHPYAEDIEVISIYREE